MIMKFCYVSPELQLTMKSCEKLVDNKKRLIHFCFSKGQMHR